jgi:hypothetical protein
LDANGIYNTALLAGEPIFNNLKDAKSEGQAIGLCFKYLKSYNWESEPDDVLQAVKRIRSEGHILSI